MSAAAVVLIDHGSRETAANAVVESVANALRARLPGRTVEIAHLELTPPNLSDAIDRCVLLGAREIVVQPFFLAPGRHSTTDIPALAEAAAARHPGVSIRLGVPLGAHPALVEAVIGRLSEGEDRRRRE